MLAPPRTATMTRDRLRRVAHYAAKLPAGPVWIEVGSDWTLTTVYDALGDVFMRPFRNLTLVDLNKLVNQLQVCGFAVTVQRQDLRGASTSMGRNVPDSKGRRMGGVEPFFRIA